MAVGIAGTAASMSSSSGGCGDAPEPIGSAADEADAAAASAPSAGAGAGTPLGADASDQVQAVVDGTVGVASDLYAHTMELTAQQLELQSTMNDLANSGLEDDDLMLDLLDQLCEVTDGLEQAQGLHDDVQAVADAVKAGDAVPGAAAQRIVAAGHQDVIDLILDTAHGTLKAGESAASMADGGSDGDPRDDGAARAAAATAAAAQAPGPLERANLAVTTFDDGSSAAVPAASCAC